MKASAGGPCVVNCMQAFSDWFYSFQVRSDRVAARKHRLYIIENFMNLHCPRCHGVILDFNGCFALYCANPRCEAAFCGWCLKDCGMDAHDHVLECPDGNGEHFASISSFYFTHNVKRVSKIRKYIDSSVAVRHRNLVLKFITKDLNDVGIDVNDLTDSNEERKVSFDNYNYDDDDAFNLPFDLFK